MPKFQTLNDTNYSRGMNNLDDQKILADGECAELVNAFPGYPLQIRKGCEGFSIDEANGTVRSTYHYVKMGGGMNGIEGVFVWLASMGICSLYFISLARHTFGSVTQFLNIFVSGFYHNFDFVTIGNIIYTRSTGINQQMRTSMFAVDIDGGSMAARPVPDANFGPIYSFDSVTHVNDANGQIKGSFIFGYSVTLVRRTDIPSWESHLPVGTYAPGSMESPETVSTRGSIIQDGLPDTAASKVSITLKMNPTDNIWHSYGFTHVRLYRTHNLTGMFNNRNSQTDDEKHSIISGATRLFLVDIPLSMAIHNGNINYVDDTPDGALAGEMNQLVSFGYTFPPSTGNFSGYKMLYHRNRLFLMHTNGNVFFSEIPGGSGGSDLEYSMVESAKYALWFKPLYYRVELDVEENTMATGMSYLGDDLYFFKENKICMVIGGDPSVAPLRTINDKVGCKFPNTIERAMIGGEEVLFFLSGTEPILIRAGGFMLPFTEFKIKALWAHADGELVNADFDMSASFEKQLDWCNTVFWGNTLWLFYKFRYEDDAKIYGYLASANERGAFEIKLANFDYRYLINAIVSTHDGRAWAVCNFADSGRGNSIVLVNFLGSEQSYDTCVSVNKDVPPPVNDRAKPYFYLKSRRIYVGPSERNMSELLRFSAHCRFREDASYNRRLMVTLANTRYRQVFDYYVMHKTSFVSNLLGAPVRGELKIHGRFEREDGGVWPTKELAGFVAYLYNEWHPNDGTRAEVIRNAGSSLNLDIDVTEDRQGEPFTHVRLIARPITRENIQFVPQADFVGEFFQYGVAMVIPKHRGFDWYSAELECVPRPQLDAEEFVGADKFKVIGADGFDDLFPPFLTPSPKFTTLATIHAGMTGVAFIEIIVPPHMPSWFNDAAVVFVGMSGIADVEITVPSHTLSWFNDAAVVSVGMSGIADVGITVPSHTLSWFNDAAVVFVGMSGIADVGITVPSHTLSWFNDAAVVSVGVAGVADVEITVPSQPYGKYLDTESGVTLTAEDGLALIAETG